MPYTGIKVQRVVNRVRRALSQEPILSENTSTNSSVLGSATDRFGDEELIDMINDAQREVATRSKASHVHGAIKTESPTESPAVPTGIILRHLNNRVFVDDVRARFLAKDTLNRLKEGGRRGSAARPVHSYENGELTTDPQPQTDITWNYVGLPTEVTALSDPLGVDERFEESVINYVLALCFRKLKRADMQAAAMIRFDWEMQAFTPDMVAGIINDKEVEVE